MEVVPLQERNMRNVTDFLTVWYNVQTQRMAIWDIGDNLVLLEIVNILLQFYREIFQTNTSLGLYITEAFQPLKTIDVILDLVFDASNVAIVCLIVFRL